MLIPPTVAMSVLAGSVTLTLAVEAGAVGAEDDRHVVCAAIGEGLCDVIGVVSHHHRLRQEPVGAGVGGVTDDVAGPAQDATLAKQRFELAQQRLRGSAGQRLGGTVGGDDGHLWTS